MIRRLPWSAIEAGVSHFILVTIFLASFPGFANPLDREPKEDPLLRRVVLFLGGDVGYSYVSTDIATELNRDGIHTDAKALASYSWPRWIFEGGAGWFFNRITGDSPNPPIIDEKVKTRAAILELGIRYKLTPRFSLGPIFQTILGTDTDFGSTGNQSERVTFVLGGQAAYVFPYRFPLKLTASIFTDLNIENRQAYFFLAGIQIGIPMSGKKKPVEPPPVKVEPTPPPEPVRFELKDVLFDFDKDSVKKNYWTQLKRLAQFLETHSSEWGTLTIEGHCDRRGTRRYNYDLSRRRTGSVKNVLTIRGVPDNRLMTFGYGEDRPKLNKESEEAWRQNRRVELVFDRLDSVKELKEMMEAEAP